MAHAETTPATAESASTQPSDSNLSRGERASPRPCLRSSSGRIRPHRNFRRPRGYGSLVSTTVSLSSCSTTTRRNPVWRSLDEVIYRGSDKAILEVPNDPRYSFVGAPAGSKVYVIPQTETKGVIWPGWNTQDPQLVSKS